MNATSEVLADCTDPYGSLLPAAAVLRAMVLHGSGSWAWGDSLDRGNHCYIWGESSERLEEVEETGWDLADFP